MRSTLSPRNSKAESKSLSRICSYDYTQALNPFAELPHISQVQAEQVVWDIPEQGPPNRNVHLGQRRQHCFLSFKQYLMPIPIPCMCCGYLILAASTDSPASWGT